MGWGMIVNKVRIKTSAVYASYNKKKLQKLVPDIEQHVEHGLTTFAKHHPHLSEVIFRLKKYDNWIMVTARKKGLLEGIKHLFNKDKPKQIITREDFVHLSSPISCAFHSSSIFI